MKRIPLIGSALVIVLLWFLVPSVQAHVKFNESDADQPASTSGSKVKPLRLKALANPPSIRGQSLLRFTASNPPPSTTVHLHGTVTDDGRPNPPGRTTTIWSKVSGPGTVTFDDASALDAIATFSTAGVYVLRLTASDSALSASDEVTVTITSLPVDTTPPSTPTHLTAFTFSDTWINLSWTGSTAVGGSGIRGYNIYRNGTLIKQVPDGETFLADRGLVAGTQYSYEVEAVDGTGNQSAKTPAVSARTLTMGTSPPTYGSAFLDLDIDLGTAVSNATKLRYKLYVAGNKTKTSDGESFWKIVFNFLSFYTPGNPQPRGLLNGIWSWRTSFTGNLCTHWPPKGTPLIGEAALGMGNTDNYKDKRIGAHTLDPVNFPTQAFEVDGWPDLWTIGANLQRNVNGSEILIEYARGTTTTAITGWGCPDLWTIPSGTYRIWHATATISGTTYRTDFLLPDTGAQYLHPTNPIQIATEAFYQYPGSFKVYIWNLEIQREGSTIWEPLRRWKLTATDASPTQNIWGMKRAIYNGIPVIEVSNDYTPTYLKQGETLELDTSR